jgi:CBS domain-containing protein
VREKIAKHIIEHNKAKDVMTGKVITLQPSESLLKAQSTMSRNRIKRIVVTEAGAIAGVLTLKDLIRAALLDQTDRELQEIRITEAMDKHFAIVEENTNVVACAKTIVGEKSRSVIVTNSEQSGKLSGIISSSDITRFFAEKCKGLVIVENYMSRPVVTIELDDKVSKASELMLENNISHIIVTRSGFLAGILSETDLLLVTLAFKSPTLRSVYENSLILFHSSNKRNLIEPSFIRLRDIFSANPTVIAKIADLADAAKVLIDKGISALPVIFSLDEISKDVPIGILTKTDIVRALSQLNAKVTR